MNRGIYPILSGTIAQENRIQVLTNNIANLRTTGFKRVTPVFQAVLASSGQFAGSPGTVAASFQPVVGPQSVAPERVFVNSRDLATDFGAGKLRETKGQFDMAIIGPGLFEVKTDQGLVYTRNGMFHLDDKNRLVTEKGDPVMGGKGELKLKKGDIRVLPNGEIEVDGAVAGKIKVVEFPEDKALRQVGEGYFVGENPKPIKDVALATGHLEESNVNAFEEMVRMIQVMRTYESGQKAFQTFDKLAELLIQDVGRVA
ncbi:MAG: flagellar hook-basal body protein [Nitrospirae bacterium]|nr:flagellar hook-basal body protein [Nitrospirota bacterium]